MSFVDQLGNTVIISSPPQRIVSLVPSQTELLAHLGLEDRVVGITKFCVHPPLWRTSKQLIGGTKNFDFDAIHNLRPDLILANKEENYREGIEALQQHYPVWVSDIANLPQALDMITGVGRLTDTEQPAITLAASIQAAFSLVRPMQQLKVLYLIWKKPWMIAASNTFIDAMLRTMGLVNSVQHLDRYPVLTDEQLSALNPDLIFLSSEPYPFKDKHITELQVLCPASTVALVDGEMFSWYGSRLLHAPAYFNTLTARLQARQKF